MTFLGHTSCSSGFIQDFLDHYGSVSNLMGYFSFEVPVDCKPWHNDP